MKKISIQIKGSTRQTTYTIYVGVGLIEQIRSLIPLHRYTKFIIVTGNKTPTIFVKKLRATLPRENEVVSIATGEKHKNIENVTKIWEMFHDIDCDRKSLVINLGGGVITDLGGFSASTYLKGIQYVNIPTTLLGQVDASNGGKTGINFDGAKNLIGSFQSPIGVIDDISTLATLPKREFISGFGEIIKHGLIRDEKYFQFVTSKKPLEFSREELTTIVERSCEIKAHSIIKDVWEIGSGKILHFGHTVGHVIETESQQSAHPILHGEAVLLGMIVETKLSFLLGLLSKEACDVIEQRLGAVDLPALGSKISISALSKRLLSSNATGKAQWTLLKRIGHAIIRHHVSDDVITKALQQTKGVLV